MVPSFVTKKKTKCKFEAVEYHPEELVCAALGYPLPKIVWESPSGQRLDRQFLAIAHTNKETKIYSEIYDLEESINDRFYFQRNISTFVFILKTIN